MFSVPQRYSLTDGQTDRRTDGRTDGRLTSYDSNTALALRASRGKNIAAHRKTAYTVTTDRNTLVYSKIHMQVSVVHNKKFLSPKILSKYR